MSEETPIPCPNCGDDIEWHEEGCNCYGPSGCWAHKERGDPPVFLGPRRGCPCTLTPAGILRALLAERDRKLAERDARLAAIQSRVENWESYWALSDLFVEDD